ncbi:MAG: response regulator transcription factor [Afipia sp.]|jgi:FixJ family two-component response regulator
MINDSVVLRRAVSQRTVLSDQPVVIVVDDDAAVRNAVQNLMSSAGMECVAFASTGELLATRLLERPGCLVLDVRMPGSSGLDLQRHLAATGNPKPIVFLTGHGDIPMSVEAMKAGAVDFLTKPVRDQTLLDAVIIGINRDLAYRAAARAVRSRVERFEKLTPRERQVLHEVARGRVNKQIAFDLGISEVTVKLHRSNLMRKMQAGSIGELIRIWEVLPVALREARPGS